MLDEESVRDGVEAGGHDREVQLVGGVAGNMVEVRHHAEHNIVVVRRGVVDNLAAHRGHAALDFGRDGTSTLLDGLLAHIRNHRAERIALQIFGSEFVAEYVEMLTKVDDGAVGFLLTPAIGSIILIHRIFQH